MLPVTSGQVVPWPANTPLYSFPRVRPEEDKVRANFPTHCIWKFSSTLELLTETTAISSLSTLAHHGIVFVPLGYSTTFPQLANVSEVRGGKFCITLISDRESLTVVSSGSPWGAVTFAGADGSRKPSALELELAGLQGQHFWNIVKKVNFA